MLPLFEWKQLVGGRQDEIPQVYHDRSPINKAGQIKDAVLILQGNDDKVGLWRSATWPLELSRLFLPSEVDPCLTDRLHRSFLPLRVSSTAYEFVKKDRLTPPCSTAHEMIKKIKQAGVPVESVFYDGEGHGFRKVSLSLFGSCVHRSSVHDRSRLRSGITFTCTVGEPERQLESHRGLFEKGPPVG